MHGFDKAHAMLEQGIAEQTGQKGTHSDEGDHKREATFRAPPALPLEAVVKRNLPQAQAVSVSTMSERITPDFEAQAKFIIDQLQKRSDGVDEDNDRRPEGKGETLLDPNDRVEGYRRYRRWVDGGVIEMWKVGTSL